jgi:pimeloyl-ACP methyl ester carboxylesterase
MDERFFTLDGLRFRYLEWGAAGAEPILLLHGFSSTATAWARVGETLGSEYHVVALDQRGHGQTEWDPSERYTDDQYAADAHALAQRLGFGQFTLIGHSMGGSIAFTYASTYPADVKRLVIEDSAPMPPGRIQADPPSSFASRAEVEQYIRKTAPNMPESAVQERVEVYYRERPDGSWGFRADVVGVRKARRGQNSDALWTHVRNVQCPALVIRAGAEPPLVSQETAERLTHENPRIEVVTVPEAGHNIHFAHFDAFMPILRQFLAQPVPVA